MASNITTLNSYNKGASNIRGEFLLSTTDPNECYTGGVTTTNNPDEFISEDTPTPTPPFDILFKGLIDGIEKFRYMIQFDWDGCLMSGANKLLNDSVTVSYESTTETWNTVPTQEVDGYIVYEAQDDGTAICIYATGNYAANTNSQGYNYIGTVVDVRNYNVIATGGGTLFSNNVRGAEIGTSSYCFNPNPCLQRIPGTIVCDNWSV